MMDRTRIRSVSVRFSGSQFQRLEGDLGYSDLIGGDAATTPDLTLSIRGQRVNLN
jgi:hypothetical protein